MSETITQYYQKKEKHQETAGMDFVSPVHTVKMWPTTSWVLSQGNAQLQPLKEGSRLPTPNHPAAAPINSYGSPQESQGIGLGQAHLTCTVFFGFLPHHWVVPTRKLTGMESPHHVSSGFIPISPIASHLGSQWMAGHSNLERACLPPKPP